jgi:hypothetical protein
VYAPCLLTSRLFKEKLSLRIGLERDGVGEYGRFTGEARDGALGPALIDPFLRRRLPVFEPGAVFLLAVGG